MLIEAAQRHSTQKLPPAALLLLRILQDHCRGKDVCWPSQARLSELMGVSVRTVQRLMAMLRAAGSVVNIGHGVYRLVAAHPSPVSSDPPSLTGDTTSGMAGHTSPASSDPPSVTGDTTPVSSGIREEELAAAAASARGLENQKAEQQLVDLGVAPRIAREVSGDHEHVSDAMIYFRLKQAEKKVGVGFLIDALRKREDHGWKRIDGKWHAPPAVERVRQEERARLERQRKEAERAAAEKAEAARKEAEANAWHQRVQARWESLSEQEREAIRQAVRRRQPLFFGDKDDRSTMFRVACLHQLEDGDATKEK